MSLSLKQIKKIIEENIKTIEGVEIAIKNMAEKVASNIEHGKVRK
jgi:hypothetical protein